MVWEPRLWPSRPWAQQAGGALLAHGRSSGAGGRARRPRYRERRGARLAGRADGGRKGLREPGATPRPPPARLQGPATSTAGPLTHRPPGPGGSRSRKRAPRPQGAPPRAAGTSGSSRKLGGPSRGTRGGTRPGERPWEGSWGGVPGRGSGDPESPRAVDLRPEACARPWSCPRCWAALAMGPRSCRRGRDPGREKARGPGV